MFFLVLIAAIAATGIMVHFFRLAGLPVTPVPEHPAEGEAEPEGEVQA